MMGMDRTVTGALMGDPTPDYWARLLAAEQCSGDPKPRIDAALAAADLQLFPKMRKRRRKASRRRKA